MDQRTVTVRTYPLQKTEQKHTKVTRERKQTAFSMNARQANHTNQNKRTRTQGAWHIPMPQFPAKTRTQA
eukprot:5196996-Prymnesium_polylepis.1